MSVRCTLENLVNMFPRWAVLVDRNGRILHFNEGFNKRFGATPGTAWLPLVRDSGSLAEAESKAKALCKYVGIEAPAPVWCDIYPLQCDGEMLLIIVLHSTRYLRTVELMYMHRIRKNSDDNLWLLDAEGRVIWFRVGASRPHSQDALGRPGIELIEEHDRPAVQRAIQEARATPGAIVHLLAHPAGAAAPAEVDMVFMPAGLYGNRFYVATRKAVPRGNRIVERLMEAYQVKTYTALSERMHINKSSITRAAQTDSAPADLLVRCHDDTGVSLDWLMTGQGTKELW